MKATHTGPNRPPRNRSVAAPYKDALIFGVISAWVVLMVVIVVTGAWKATGSFVLAIVASVITFAVVTPGAMLMNKLVAHQTHETDTIDHPVLR